MINLIVLCSRIIQLYLIHFMNPSGITDFYISSVCYIHLKIRKKSWIQYNALVLSLITKNRLSLFSEGTWIEMHRFRKFSIWETKRKDVKLEFSIIFVTYFLIHLVGCLNGTWKERRYQFNLYKTWHVISWLKAAE